MQSPSHPATEDRLRRRAQQYLDAGQLVAAQATLESLLNRAPQDASAQLQLAGVMLARGQLRASSHRLLHLAQSPPRDPAQIVELARRLYQTGETVAARRCLDLRMLVRSDSAPVLVLSAQLCWVLDEVPTALALMERAMTAGADDPDAHFLYAQLLQCSGRVDAAGEALGSCLRRWPAFGGAAMAQANLQRQTPQANHVDFLQEQLRRMPLDRATAEGKLVSAEFESALFKELDDLGEHTPAWAALARSNAIMHALNPYDAEGEVALVEAIIARSLHDGHRAVRSWPASRGPVPIFIIGMPRSGIGLLDRMLANHSRIASPAELNVFPQQLRWLADLPGRGPHGRLELAQRTADLDIQALGARFLEQTQWRARGRAYYINKLPLNLHFVDLIRRALPHAPILHMVRDPMDACFSNLKTMFGHTAAYSYDMTALAHYFGQYQRLMDHWHRLLPDAMLDVDYAALASDPEATIRRVLDYCGLDFEPACTRAERRPLSLARPDGGRASEATHDRPPDRWVPYAAQLEPLRQALA